MEPRRLAASSDPAQGSALALMLLAGLGRQSGDEVHGEYTDGELHHAQAALPDRGEVKRRSDGAGIQPIRQTYRDNYTE